MDLATLSLKEANQGLKGKRFSSRELTKAIISRHDKLESELKSFLTTTFEQALKQADSIDKEIPRKELNILSGIPVAIKDVIITKGVRTTAASKILENFIPPYDASVIKKLKDQDYILLGKTNCDEFAMGSSTENSAYKITRNPHDLKRVPGGSSGGSAAAVAANLCIFSLGSDTGGSIRQPSSLCGVVGLKPTYGRVSRYGLIAMASSLDQIGPITKTVEDAALVLNVIAGYDDYDATSVKEKVPDYTKNLKMGIKNLKMGLPKEYFSEGLDRGIKETILKVVKKLEDLGAKIFDIELPHQEYALPCYYIIMPSEVSANLARFDGIRFGKTREFFGDEAKRRIMLGTYTLSKGYYDQYYNRAVQVRELIKRDFIKAFEEVDVIVGPTSPTVAWKIGQKVNDPIKMYLSDIYTVTANLVGIPAISIPCGKLDGLPVGLQIMGPHFREDLVLQVAYSYEQGTKN